MQWGACDKCGGQMKRNRQIETMPDNNGSPCPVGASEETKKCIRQCHEPVFCEWSKWEEDGECSVTCGTGSVKHVRYLQATKQPKEPLQLSDKAAVYSGLEEELDAKVAVTGRRRREILLSFGAGGLLSFVAAVVGTFASRTPAPQHPQQPESVPLTDA